MLSNRTHRNLHTKTVISPPDISIRIDWEHVFVSGMGPRYSEREARHAIARSHCYAEALRRLDMRPAGGNHLTLRKYAESIWKIPTDHFNPDLLRDKALQKPARPLEEILSRARHIREDTLRPDCSKTASRIESASCVGRMSDGRVVEWR